MPIQQAGRTDLDYLGYSEVNLKSDFPKIDLTVPLLVVPTIDYHDMVPVTLGTKTLKYLIDQKLLEDKDLPSNWITTKESVLTREKMLSSPDTPIGVARLSKSVHIPAFGSKDVQCLAKTHAMMVRRAPKFLMELKYRIPIQIFNLVGQRLQLELETLQPETL